MKPNIGFTRDRKALKCNHGNYNWDIQCLLSNQRIPTIQLSIRHL